MPNPTCSSISPTGINRRLRAAAHRGLGGASSMLRLSRTADTRLPSGAALSDWADRAAAMLDLTPMMVGAPYAAPTPAASSAGALAFTPGVREARS
jgi:hypothetical protein